MGVKAHRKSEHSSGQSHRSRRFLHEHKWDLQSACWQDQEMERKIKYQGSWTFFESVLRRNPHMLRGLLSATLHSSPMRVKGLWQERHERYVHENVHHQCLQNPDLLQGGDPDNLSSTSLSADHARNRKQMNQGLGGPSLS